MTVLSDGTVKTHEYHHSFLAHFARGLTYQCHEADKFKQILFYFIHLAIKSTNTGHSHHSNDQQKSSEDDDDDDDMNSFDDENDDNKYATARDEIGRGEDDVERFALPDESNQICTYLMQRGQGTSANPSKKSSAVVLGGSQIKTDSDMSANFGNYYYYYYCIYCVCPSRYYAIVCVS